MKRALKRMAVVVGLTATITAGVQSPAFARWEIFGEFPNGTSCDYAGRYYAAYHNWPMWECRQIAGGPAYGLLYWVS